LLVALVRALGRAAIRSRILKVVNFWSQANTTRAWISRGFLLLGAQKNTTSQICDIERQGIAP
jgi:hypothetical protein